MVFYRALQQGHRTLYFGPFSDPPLNSLQAAYASSYGEPREGNAKRAGGGFSRPPPAEGTLKSSGIRVYNPLRGGVPSGRGG